jgi:hypothetical protein
MQRIFKYLKETLDFGLWYSSDEDFTLTIYTDEDWVGSVDVRKITRLRGESIFN